MALDDVSVSDIAGTLERPVALATAMSDGGDALTNRAKPV